MPIGPRRAPRKQWLIYAPGGAARATPAPTPATLPIMMAYTGANGVDVTTGGSPNTWLGDTGVTVRNPQLDDGNNVHAHSPSEIGCFIANTAATKVLRQPLGGILDSASGFRITVASRGNTATLFRRNWWLWDINETNFAAPTLDYVRGDIDQNWNPDRIQLRAGGVTDSMQNGSASGSAFYYEQWEITSTTWRLRMYRASDDVLINDSGVRALPAAISTNLGFLGVSFTGNTSNYYATGIWIGALTDAWHDFSWS